MSREEEILKGILSIIEKISNAHYQQNAWIEKKAHPYAFFEETMHQLFDDFEFEEVLNNYKIYGISNEQHRILIKFYEILDQYSDEKMSWLQAVDSKEILEDSRWHEIQKIAKKMYLFRSPPPSARRGVSE